MIHLPENYEIRELETEPFREIWEPACREVFDDQQQIFRLPQYLTDEEKTKSKALRENLADAVRINLIMYHGDEVAGWSFGFQESSSTFYMCNSAVYSAHRRQGLYTALMQHMVQRATDLGFLKIYSRHNASNNAVIIPKLKAGFHITSLEICDLFGAMVNLSFFPQPIRNKMLHYRTGESKPDDEIKKILGL